MRNLKKVLSLALALVMLLGMMVVGAGAVDTGFKDDAGISDSFKEAAAVTKALGVMKGSSDNLNPSGNIVRAEAFILSLRVDGSNADAIAEKWPVSANPFNDVSMNKWYAHYMAYGKEFDLINGDNNGNYHPDNNVTVVEYSILLLKQLGFDASRYTGAKWNVNAAADALAAGLYEGLGNVNYYTHELTREEACQMVFNAILYSPTGEKSYKVGNQSFDDAFEAYIYAQNNGGQIEITTAKDSLAVKNFGLKKVDASANGRVGYVWLAGTKEITDFIATDNVIYTGTGGKADNQTGYKADPGYKCYVNGKEVTNDSAFDGKMGARGNEVTLVDADGNGKYDKVLVIEKTFGEVSTEPVEKDGWVSIPSLGIIKVNADKVKGWEGLAEDDKVLTYEMDSGVTYIEKLDVVTAACTARTGKADGTGGTTEWDYRVGGTTYRVASSDATKSGEAHTALTEATKAGGEEVNIYLDADKNIWFAESAVVVPIDYAVLLDIVWVEVITAGGTNNGYAEAQLLLADGTKIVRRVATLNGAYPVMADGSTTMASVLAGDNTNFLTAAGGKTTVKDAYNDTSAAKVDKENGDYTLDPGAYYRWVKGSDTVSDKTKGSIYVGIKNDNNSDENATFENVIYSYYEDDKNPNLIYMTEVGIVDVKGTVDPDIEQTVDASNSSNAYTQGQPTIGGATTVNGTGSQPKVSVDNNTVFLFKNEAKENSYTRYQGIVGDKAMISVKADATANMSVRAVRKDGTSVATLVYVMGKPNTQPVSEFVFITSKGYSYDSETGIYTYNAIVKGEVTTVSAKPTTKNTSPEKVIDGIGLYEVTEKSGSAITAVAKISSIDLSKGIAHATISSTGASVTKPTANVVELDGNNSLVYDSNTPVFYIDKDGNVTDGLVAKMGKYEAKTLDGVWAVAKGTSLDKDESLQYTVDTLYVWLTSGGSELDTGDATGVNNVIIGANKDTRASNVLDTTAILNLKPGVWTFDNIPKDINDLGTGKTAKNLLLFRWNNVFADNKQATIIIKGEDDTLAFFGQSASRNSGPHFDYIAIGAKAADVAGYAVDQCAVLSDGEYTWTITVPGATANDDPIVIGTGSFTVRW